MANLRSATKRYKTTKEVVVPKGVVVELTDKQAAELQGVVKPLGDLRNDLNAQVAPEDKVLPQEEEE